MEPVNNTKILDAVLTIAGEQGWRDLTIDMVAERTGFPASEIIRVFPDKRRILNALADRLERLAEEAVDVEAGNPSLPVPERLFDVIMTRFELLQERRDGYAAIISAARLDPRLALASLCHLASAMGMVLRQAGLREGGALGCLRRKVLGALAFPSCRCGSVMRARTLGRPWLRSTSD